MKRIKNLFKAEVLQNMSKLSLGTVLAQLIPFLFSPFIARLYTAENYGAFAAILSLVNMIAVIVNGRYDLCVVLPKEDRKAEVLVFGNWLVGFLVSLLAGVLLFVFSDELSLLMEVQFGNLECVLVTLVLVAISLWQPLNYFLIRRKEFTKVAINKVVQTTTLALVTLALGWLGWSNGLVVGYVMGFYALAVFTLYQIRSSFKRIINSSTLEVSEVLKEYSAYTKFTAIPALMNSVAAQLGVYLFLFYFSSETTGYYSFSKMYIFAPMTIIGGSLSKVYFQRISEKYAHKKRIFKEIKFLFIALLSMAVLAIVFVQLFGVHLFQFIFGEQWTRAGEFSQILIFYFAIQFIVSPLSNILYSVNEVKLAAIFPVVYLCIMTSMFFIPKMDIESFLPIYTIAESLPYVVYLSLIVIAIRRYENGLNE